MDSHGGRHDSGEVTIPIPTEVLAQFRAQSRPPPPVIVCTKCATEMVHDYHVNGQVCLDCGSVVFDWPGQHDTLPPAA